MRFLGTEKKEQVISQPRVTIKPKHVNIQNPNKTRELCTPQKRTPAGNYLTDRTNPKTNTHTHRERDLPH
jgi:hypothetical protein